MKLEERTWVEFSESGLLWWINRSLHLFGWAIVVDVDHDTARAYPARTSWRGFSGPDEADGFLRLTRHIHDNASEVLHDAESSIGPTEVGHRQ